MKINKAALFGGLAVALTLSACGSGGSAASSGDVITLAVAGPMTGENASYGLNQYKGVKLAADEINAAGGVAGGPLKGKKFKVVKFDDVADPNQGASVAQKICDDTSILTVFGHSNSAVTLAAEPIYERCGVPLIVSYSSNPAITAKLHKNLYRTIVDDASMGKEMADFAKNNLSYKKVGVIASDDDYGAGLKINFTTQAKTLDLTIVDAITTSAQQKDFTPQFTKLRNDGADGLMLLNTYTDAALQIKQARAMGWNVPILMTSGSNNPDLIKIAGGKAADGSFVTAVFDPNSQDPKAKKFVAAYTKANGESPSEAAATAYDSAFVLFDTLKAGAKDRQSVVKQIGEIGTFMLPLRGEFSFDENHGAKIVPGKPSQVLLQVKNGAIDTYTK